MHPLARVSCVPRPSSNGPTALTLVQSLPGLVEAFLAPRLRRVPRGQDGGDLLHLGGAVAVDTVTSKPVQAMGRTGWRGKRPPTE